MIFLILTVACSSALALILKDNHVRLGNTAVLLVGNYLTASLLGLVFLAASTSRTFSVGTLLMGAALGVTFVGTFFVFAKAVGAAGAALSTVSSRLSLAIPVAVSAVLFREQLTQPLAWGFALTFFTLVFFYLSMRADAAGNHRPGAYLYLVLLFVGIGVNDLGMKLFEEWRPATDRPFFLVCIFAFSLLYSAAVLVWKSASWGLPIRSGAFRRGLVLGVPNILGTFFLLSALARMKAVQVYPIVNIGVILVTATAAALLWRERLNRFGAVALVAGAAAIVLMGL